MNRILDIGRKKINEVLSTLSKNADFQRILYVSDNVVDILYGNDVLNQLKEIGAIIKEFVDNNTISYAMDIAKMIFDKNIDCIVALGGGKVLDVCKFASYVSKTPILSIPTTAANDGVASPIAVLKDTIGKPKSIGCAVPDMILIDLDIICKCPEILIKAGIGDTISNYMALKDWSIACQEGKDTMNGYAYMMSKNSIDVMMNSHYDSICPEFVESLVDSLVLSGIAMDFAGSSRPVSGSEHLFSHALDYYNNKNNLHGLQVALGTIAMLKIIGEDYSEVLGLLNRFKVDVNPINLGISKELFILSFQNAKKMRENRYTYLNKIDLETDMLKRVYNELTEEL